MINKTQTSLLVGALTLTIAYAHNSFAHVYDAVLNGDDLTSEHSHDKGGSLPPQSKSTSGHSADDNALNGNDLTSEYSHDKGSSLPPQSRHVSRSGAVARLNGDDLTAEYSHDKGSSLPPQ
ncbi:MAG: hypothetical protein ABFQ95_07905 [Pseudomonadota bacterium]